MNIKRLYIYVQHNDTPYLLREKRKGKKKERMKDMKEIKEKKLQYRQI